MKRFIYILIFSITAVSLMNAQDYKVDIQNPVVKKEEGNVILTFEVVVPSFPSNYSVMLSPVIFDGNGNRMYPEPVKLVGSKRNITDKRSGNTGGKRHLMKGKENQPVLYSRTFPYESWMKYISLSVEQMVESCCDMYRYPLQPMAEKIVLDFVLTPYFDIQLQEYELTELEKYDRENPFLHPMEDYPRRYEILKNEREEGSSSLLFSVSSHTIDESYQGNKDVMEAMGKAFELIRKDPDVSLSKIVIGGYASPEGSLAYNTALAQRRAEAVKKYTQTLMESPHDEIFELYNGREDWDGLRNMVAKSNMYEKNEVLEIIDSYTMEQEIRKTKLKQLNGGIPYKYILENFYPKLRSSGYIQVYYEIKRSATVATVVTDEKGRKTWIDPGSARNRAVTAINKATLLMVENRFDEAMQLLQDHNDDPLSWNNLGVCYMMTGNYNKAEFFLRQALGTGDENAFKNLKQLKWARETIME